MYRYKDDINITINQKKASEVLGFAQPTLSNILNRKVCCKKSTAYAITKYINSNFEIEDLFDRVEKGA